ncbi:restriction endonuclease subunit S [Acidiphilium sp.]|uniref:restriction endonuclease subunit S n=1 Tax=Acidiphilium sp. TaxID=527 RepID=UPI0025865AD0|nr:restriction endonuclease subunit S [Acidiphilium sp.]
MSGWPLRALGDVIEINPRQPKGIATSQEVSFVPMAAVDEIHGSIVDRQVREFGAVSKGFPTFADGDVLFAKITPCMENGKAAIATDLVNGIGAGSTEFFVLRPSQDILAEYVFHFVRRAPFREACKANFTGSAGQQRVPRSYLERVVLPIPPLDEQRRIVGLLDRAAEIRRRADAARAKARAIIPALFLDMFGDPATNPKGWRTLRLGDALLTGLQNGLYRPASDYGEGTRILRIDSFDDGKIGDQRRLKRLRIDTASIKKFGLHEGDIIVNRVNSPPQLGKSVLIHKLDEPTVFESNMMRMQVDPEILIPAIVGVMLQIPSVRQNLIRNAKHAINQSSINQSDVTAVGVFAPPLTLQTDFAEQAQRIEATARALDAAAAKAEAMAAGLSAEVFGSA